MNAFRLVLVAVVFLATACNESPTGPGPVPPPPINYNVDIALSLRVGESQEWAKSHLNTLEVLTSAGEVYEVPANGVVSFTRDKRDAAVTYSVRTKAGAEAVFCPMLSESVSLYGDQTIDVVPIDYLLSDGPYSGQHGDVSSCYRIDDSCTLHAGQDGVFYPDWVCGSEGSTDKVQWKYTELSFNSEIAPAFAGELLALAKSNAVITFGSGEWYQDGGDRGVKVYLDPSNPNCGSISSKISEGVATDGLWLCPNYDLLKILQNHESLHIFGYAHMCGRMTLMAAPECQEWRVNYYTLEDILSTRMEMEYRIMYHSGTKPLMSLDGVLRASRS